MIDMNKGDTQVILKACMKRGIDLKTTSYILATAFWETNRTMKPVQEAYWLSDAWRRSNLRYYPWHGRGYVQLTWEKNYKKASKELGVDFTKSPDKLMEPDNAARILVDGSMDGWFTGKKLGDYLNEANSDYVGARHVINGSDKAEEIADIALQYFGKIGRMPYKDNWLDALIAAVIKMIGSRK